MSNVLLSSIVLSPFVLGIALVSALSADTKGGGSGGGGEPIEDRHFAVESVDGVEIDMLAGDLTLRGGAGDQVSVRVLESHAAAGCEFQVRHEGRTVEIESKNKGLPGRCDFDLEIIVPGPLPVEIELGAGDMTLDGLTGVLDLATGAGDVTGNARGTLVEVSTGAGDIELSGLVSAIEAKTGAGGITLSFDAAPKGTIEASTGVGDVSVLLPGNAVVDASASTGLGSVRQTLTEQPGADTVVHASTGIGDVRLGSK